MKRTIRLHVIALIAVLFITIKHNALFASPYMANVDETLVNLTLYVSPSGNDSSGNGTAGNPFKKISKAVDVATNHILSNVGGAKIILAEGTYRENLFFEIVGTNLTINYPLVIEGETYGNCILTGSDDWSGGWTSSGLDWYTLWLYDWGVHSPGGWPFSGDLTVYMPEITRRGKMVFIDNTMMTQVTSSGDLASGSDWGTFYVDEADDKLYVRPPTTVANLNSHTVDVAVRTGDTGHTSKGLMRLLGWNKVVLRNIVFQHTAGFAGALSLHGAKDILVDSCIFRNNNGTAVSIWNTLHETYISENHTFTNCIAMSNGTAGLCMGSKSTMIDCESSYNNWRYAMGHREASGFGTNEPGDSLKTVAAGIKLGAVDHVYIHNVDIISNKAHGLWLDVNIKTIHVVGCRIIGNKREDPTVGYPESAKGLHWEICQGPLYASNNIIADNDIGIDILSASNSHFFNNIVSNNRLKQVNIAIASRPAGGDYDAFDDGNDPNTGEVEFVSNLVIGVGTSQTNVSIGGSDEEEVKAFWDKSYFASNRYYNADSINVFNDGITYGEYFGWRTNFEVESVWGPAGSTITATFTSPTNHNVFDSNPTFDVATTGAVTKVVYFTNNVNIGEDTSAPYSLTPTLTIGRHYVTAVATNSSTGDFATAALRVDKEATHELLLHLPFDESGSINSNGADGGTAGSVTASVTYDASGLIGGAGAFDTAGKITIPDDAAYEFQRFTFSAWIKPETYYSNENGWVHVIQKMNWGNGEGYRFGTEGTGNNTVAGIIITNSAPIKYAGGQNDGIEIPVEASNTWQHIALTKSADYLIAYSNGIEVARIDCDMNHQIQYGANDLNIGLNYAGLIDDLRIYTYDIGADEVMNLYLLGVVDVTPPTVVTLVSPTNNTITSNTKPTLTWNPTTDNTSGIGGYLLSVSNTAGGTEAIYNPGVATTYTIGAPLSDGIYAWRVAAYDGKSNTNAYSASRTFTVDTGVDVPTPLTPTNNSRFGTWAVTFAWSGVADISGISNYTVAISNMQTGFVRTIETNVTNFILPYMYALSNGAYTWRVCAHDTVGNTGAWTTTNTFTIDITWLSCNIGNVATTGSFSMIPSAGEFAYTITGSGSGFLYDMDEAHFAYKELSGTGGMIARLIGVAGETTETFTGLMVRTSLSGDTPFLSVGRKGSATALYYRDAEDGQAISASYTAYDRFAIDVADDIYTAKGSADGTNWTTLTSLTVTGASTNTLIGFTATSFNDGVDVTGTFADLAFTGEVGVSSVTQTTVTYSNTNTSIGGTNFGMPTRVAIPGVTGSECTFGVYLAGVEGRRDVVVRIFSLDGVLVQTLLESTANTVVTWDGRNAQGERVPQGVYIYHMEISDGTTRETQNGTFLILR